MRFIFVAPAIVTSVLLAACATTGSGSSSARPVFYPNATLNKVGEAKAREEADVCIAKAQSAGLTPDEKTNAVAHDAARGAAVGGVAGSVGSLVTGKSLERSLGNGVAGAAVGGSVGAVSGAFKDKPNTTYRRFVQRCLTEKGFDVIGWN
jgi:hypothetical protein